MEERLIVDENRARHEFSLLVLTSSNRRGMLPVTATYSFKDEKIELLRIAVSRGVLIFSRKEGEDLGIINVL